MGEDLLESRFGDREAISLENSSYPDKRHWLITDGTGSFAAASLTGAKLSRYDGLCIALAPPVQRVNLLAGTDEILVVPENGTKYQLATNNWRDGSVGPEGWRLLKSFSHDVCPTWIFEVEEGWLVKQVAMLQAKRQLVLGYHWVPKRENLPVELTTELVVNFRDFHSETHGSQSWQFLQTVSDGKVHIKAYETAPSLGVTYNCGHYEEDF
jgi:predicted glycogen debranching enzyme